MRSDAIVWRGSSRHMLNTIRRRGIRLTGTLCSASRGESTTIPSGMEQVSCEDRDIHAVPDGEFAGCAATVPRIPRPHPGLGRNNDQATLLGYMCLEATGWVWRKIFNQTCAWIGEFFGQ